MEYFPERNTHAAEEDYTVRTDEGAEVIQVIAGLLVAVAGLGLAGYTIGGTWGALSGTVAGIVIGIAYNNLMRQLAKWGSLIALAGLAVYGTISVLA
ncbi:MAG: hypothetical protein MUD02_02710 [Bacteroidales bacterium]|jgi:hypothetical protein|nr:hypothetical protein [Bacteroidales bacterium]